MALAEGHSRVWMSPWGGQARLYHGEQFTRIATDPIRLFSHATNRLLEAFLDALARDVTPPCHADDNRKTLALMLAAYDSADTRRTIEMTY